MKTIKLPNRYGLSILLEYIKDNDWKLKIPPKNPYRVIGNKGNIRAVDLPGGPFIAVGDKIENKIVVNISDDGLLITLKDEFDN